ncbi:hypothetical protein Tco_1370760 [Tanacetum coccineum]
MLRTTGESSVAGTAGVVTIVGVYGPLRMHFRKASPFGLVSMYHKNRDRHCAYRPVASIGGRSLEPAAIIIMNQEEIQQAAREETWVPKVDRVKISTTNMRIDPIMTQKEVTYQVQFWHTVTKVKESTFYEFKLVNKKCLVDVEVFRQALDICPRVPGKEFVVPPSEGELLTFLIRLRYKGILTHLLQMFIDHMHQPWRTLASIINKCLSGKTTSNDRLRQSRVAIVWGMFYKK